MKYRPFEALYSEILFEQVDSHKFNKIFDDSRVDFLQEKYLKYSPPQDKEKLMYDFYVLSYLKYLLSQPSKQHRDLPEDIEDSVNDAVNSLYPYLRQELLNATFYAICAEMRHLVAKSDNYNLFKEGTPTENKKYREMMVQYLRYMKHKDMESENMPEKDILFPEKPSSRVRGKEGEASNIQERNNSYKAAHYAMKKTNSLPSDFVKMAGEAFTQGQWFSSYGGKAWANICKGYLRLNQAEKINPNAGEDKGANKKKSQGEDMGVAIDHVYDLQHNTDTVFNKLNTYLKDGNYRWLKKALDHKANVKSYFDLLPMASGTVKSLAPRILYNKLGNTWEQHVQYTSPKGDTNGPQKKLPPSQQVKANIEKLKKTKAKAGQPKIGDTVTSPHTTETWDIGNVFTDEDDGSLKVELKSNKTNTILSTPYDWESLQQMGYKIKKPNVPSDYPKVGDILSHPSTDDTWEVTEVIEQTWGQEVKLKDVKNDHKHPNPYSWTSLKNGGYTLSTPSKTRPSSTTTHADAPKVGDILSNKYDKNEQWKVMKAEPDENGLLLTIKNFDDEHTTNKYYWQDLKNAGHYVTKPSSVASPTSNEEIPEVGNYINCGDEKFKVTKVIPLADGDYTVHYVDNTGFRDYIEWSVIKTWDCILQKRKKKERRKPSKTNIGVGDTIYATSGFGSDPAHLNIIDSLPNKGVYLADIVNAQTGEILTPKARLNKQLLDKMVKDGVWENLGIQI